MSRRSSTYNHKRWKFEKARTSLFTTKRDNLRHQEVNRLRKQFGFNMIAFAVIESSKVKSWKKSKFLSSRLHTISYIKKIKLKHSIFMT
jgi:hypothetical protein